jgi:hypothetical protein
MADCGFKDRPKARLADGMSGTRLALGARRIFPPIRNLQSEIVP